MIMPEENNSSFSALAEEFNKSAKAFSAGAAPSPSFEGLTTKFDILWKFKAETPQDYGRLTQGLFECATDIMKKCAQSGFRDDVNPHITNVQQIFTVLMRPEQMQYLPDNASDILVDRALDLIRKHETVKYEYNWNNYQQHKNDLVKFAQSLSGFAEKLRAPKTSGAALAPAKTIAPPAKRLTVASAGA